MNATLKAGIICNGELPSNSHLQVLLEYEGKINEPIERAFDPIRNKLEREGWSYIKTGQIIEAEGYIYRIINRRHAGINTKGTDPDAECIESVNFAISVENALSKELDNILKAL